MSEHEMTDAQRKILEGRLREIFGQPRPAEPEGDVFVGPTGEFPQGQYGEHDQGELSVGFAVDPANGKVVVHFGVAVDWLAMSPDEADGLADMLRSKAAECRAAGGGS